MTKKHGIPLLYLVVMLSVAGCAQDMRLLSPLLPEQRTIAVLDVSELVEAPLRDVPPPATVSDPQPNNPERYLSLDEAIRIGLANAQVVRILAGVTAVVSGQTIYDPAIANTNIDQQQADFDPTLGVKNTFSQTSTPFAVLDHNNPRGASITGLQTESYALGADLSKKTLTGGTASLSFSDTLSHFEPGVFPLNPQNQRAATISFQQPLLQGAGAQVNLVPIVVARINTERSFYQLKDSMQESVRGMIEAYWNLVFARTDAWARRQQVEQANFFYRLEKASKDVGLKSGGEVAQAQSSLAIFKASLVGAEANVIQREAALRNILGMPASDGIRLIPSTPPSVSRLDVNWAGIVQLAQERRPDLVQLKLIIEADQQLLLQADNLALPKVDALALYRWNALEGTTPTRDHIGSGAGQLSDWTLGINIALPLGLRKSRAALLQQKLILTRDWANLDQGLHAAINDLTTSTRNLAQFFEQYKANQEARKAARLNLDQQLGDNKARGGAYLNVLQAITDWGNTVSAEALALTQYNTELANLERQTGTILETHGVQFYEERVPSLGPLGRLARRPLYPLSLVPGPNTSVYPNTSAPAENIFELNAPKVPKPKLP